ncbi:sulfite exporter TauE/SafE family protein [Hymenobacter negativus]|uniref:Sulfite exporter TauE/SafE family protein n=1 Tax=Hymenobacter negativus TaxID=2795026 RepID=A0ABS3QJ64_9BACT|nr:sulfite exporter TauE/SafE family protein [Hymenobacter negativus]MBO2011280.1 sulfite exporter TauE/SafE family protein [Hymenobacter negativus]
MFWAGFLFGLLGSFHCVGMCGALALALPGQASGRLLYQLGRVSTYATLGAGAGLLGQGLRLAGVQQSLSMTSGVLILVLVAVPERYSSRLAATLGLSRPLAWVKTTLAGLFQQPSNRAMYATGLLNGLLPCGLVYLALAGALSAPGVAGAAAYMTCFGLGTLPLMLGLSLSGRLVPLAWRTRMRQAVPYTAALLAVLFIVRGLGLGIPYLSPQLSATAVPAKRPPLTVHYCH